MTPWVSVDEPDAEAMLEKMLAEAVAVIDLSPPGNREAHLSKITELTDAATGETLAGDSLPAFVDILIELGETCSEAMQADRAMLLLHGAHELARLSRTAAGATRQRAALRAACVAIVRAGTDKIAAAGGDESIDEAIAEVDQLLERAGSSEAQTQWRMTVHEQALDLLEAMRGAHASEPEFERNLIRNNIAAVLGLSLPLHLKGVQTRWRSIALHVAPHALTFAETEFPVPQPLSALLDAESLGQIESAIETGEARSLVEALAQVEEVLEENLARRLDVNLDWLPPAGKVNIRRGVPDPKWLKAKSSLERGHESAVREFENLDFSKNNRDINARMWHGYALGKLGKSYVVQIVREIFDEVVRSEHFDPQYHAVAHWNLAVACSKSPIYKDSALDALLPLLEQENHPAGTLDVALSWALAQQRSDVLESLCQRCRHHEAHLLAALINARSALDAGEIAVEPVHIRRLAAILRNPDQEFPHPAEEFRDMRRLDQIVEDFKRLQLATAGVEWFRQRLNSPRERYSYKNWDCLAALYEFTHDYPASWRARCKSLDSTLKSAKRRSQPQLATRPLKKLLEWGQHNDQRRDALRVLRNSWRDTGMSQDEVVVWERKLADADGSAVPPVPGTPAPAPPGPVDKMDAGEARELVDRVAPLFDKVTTSQHLVEHSREATGLLDAVAVLRRSAPAPVVSAIRDVVALATELQDGPTAERIDAIGAAMRDSELAITGSLEAVPFEVTSLVKAVLRALREARARITGVAGLTLTMPHALKMTLAEAADGDHATTRLAVRLSNPATEPADAVKVTVLSESDELVIETEELTVGSIAAEAKAVVDFAVSVRGMPATGGCGLRCHVAYRSAGFDRAVHARAEVRVVSPAPPIPVHDRFVTSAPVSADRVDLFQGRDRELAELKEAFSGGRLRRLYFVNGIRRVGKSSLMRHLGRVCGSEFLTLIVTFDMDAGLNDRQLVRVLLKKVNDQLRDDPGLAEHLITLPGAEDFELDPPWTVFEDALRRLQHSTGRKLLLCLDELQEVVQRIADPAQPLSDGLLSRIREHAQQQSDLLFICTGSESFEVMKRRFDNRLWGNLQPYNVSFVDKPAMERIVTVPLQPDEVTWLPESLAALWDLTEGHPWVTQVLAIHAVTALNRDRRRTVTPGDISRAAAVALTEANISDLWWNETEGVVTAAHRQVAFLVLKHQPGPRQGVTTDDLFQACSRSGVQTPGIYVDAMANLELLTFEGTDTTEGRWRVRGGFLEKYLEGLLAREVSEARVGTFTNQSTQPLGIFLDVENVKRSLVDALARRSPDDQRRLRRRLDGDEIGRRLLTAARRHGKPAIKWAVANWHAADLQDDQMKYKDAGYQPDIAGSAKANASDHVLKEHIHSALRDVDLNAYVIGTGDGDFREIIHTLQSAGKYIVLWATRENMSNAFGANLRSDDGTLTVEFLEDIVFADDDDPAPA